MRVELPASFPVLESERLKLRAFEDRDVARLVHTCAPKNVAQNTRTLPHPFTEKDARDFLERCAREYAEGKFICWAACRKPDGLLVAHVGMRTNRAHNNAELGYIVAPDEQGKGYATESALAAIRWAFGPAGLHRVEAGWYPHNPASGRVLEKLGFTREGMVREAALRFGQYYDCIIMGMLKREFEARYG